MRNSRVELDRPLYASLSFSSSGILCLIAIKNEGRLARVTKMVARLGRMKDRWIWGWDYCGPTHLLCTGEYTCRLGWPSGGLNLFLILTEISSWIEFFNPSQVRMPKFAVYGQRRNERRYWLGRNPMWQASGGRSLLVCRSFADSISLFFSNLGKFSSYKLMSQTTNPYEDK